jgi:hypothetical protein
VHPVCVGDSAWAEAQATNDGDGDDNQKVTLMTPSSTSSTASSKRKGGKNNNVALVEHEVEGLGYSPVGQVAGLTTTAATTATAATTSAATVTSAFAGSKVSVMLVVSVTANKQ